MAEDEIIKHTKAAYKAWKNPYTSVKHKIKEIALEVMIIVFAVSLSISLHNWSESRKDREEEREFLTGLKKDLQSDTTEMNHDRASYRTLVKGFTYFLTLTHGAPVNKDSINEYSWVLFNNTTLIPNISRFEALKGSGKLDIIEDKELLNHILDLYQEDIPHVNFLNQSFNDNKTRTIITYLQQHVILDSNDHITNLPELIHSPQMHVYLTAGNGALGNIDAYTACINKSAQIMQEIDEALK